MEEIFALRKELKDLKDDMATFKKAERVKLNTALIKIAKLEEQVDILKQGTIPRH